MEFFERFKRVAKAAYNAFSNKDPTTNWSYESGYGDSYYRNNRRLSFSNEKSIMAPIINQISVDASEISLHHVEIKDDMYNDIIDSDLNYCISKQANKDQTAKEFFRDVYSSILDEGVIAIVITDADGNPYITDNYRIKALRVGKILNWYPDHVRVSVYNDNKGIREEIVVPKAFTPIIENPFYSVMNSPNSTLRRLIKKLNLLDIMDEDSSPTKLDLIFQLPYTIKSESRRKEAEQRRKDIERQLSGSKYGIAYADATERIIQLNRPAENNLLAQVEYLTKMFHSQLGISEKVFNGEAGDMEMTNYYSRTIEPLVESVVNKMDISFISQNSRTRGQTIAYFRDPFKLLPLTSLADTADKFTRNEILTSNEFRSIIGFRPDDDPRSDELRNKNISPDSGSVKMPEDNENSYDDDNNFN